MSTKKKRHISPPYPFISLKACVDLASKLHKTAGQAEVTKENALKYMGLFPIKPISNRSYSALTSFGLVTERRSGNTKKVSVTELARKIILAQGDDSPIKTMALQTAASNYEIIRELRMRWTDGLPEDDSILNALMFDHKFSDRAAKDFLPAFKETYEFAKLGGSVILTDEQEEEEKFNGNESMAVAEKDLQETPLVALEGFQEYTLTLAEGKEVRFLTSSSLTQDDLEFAIQWIRRLDILDPIEL